MSSSARTLGPPVALGLASPAMGSAAASRSRASGRTIAVVAAAASHLNTGLLLASGPGQTRRALHAPGAQPMQTASMISRKMPKLANDDFPSPTQRTWRLGLEWAKKNSLVRGSVAV